MKKVACIVIFLFYVGVLSLVAHKGAYIEPNKTNGRYNILFYYEHTEGARIMEDPSIDGKIALGDLLPQEINGWQATVTEQEKFTALIILNNSWRDDSPKKESLT
jgi:hypothetical protein